MTPDEFIKAIGPAAIKSMHERSVPASFTTAQAALESGWGKSELAVKARNLFGVKADASWRGPAIVMPTKEFLEGKWVTVPARWRFYVDWLACINDHSDFLRKNPRYAPAFCFLDDGEAFARGIAAAGYATDPDYAHKIIMTMRAHNMAEMDK